MCGITGIVNLSGTVPDLPRHIKTMTNALRHRGPDGEGFLFSSGSDIISAYGNDTPQNVISSSLNYSPDISIDNITESNFQFAFGHRRLSVIDTSPSGHQPMCDAQKQVWLCFNGEIYNYIELREELKQTGIVFESNSDSEVILKSYLYWGESCVSHFNGMWSFVIYDSRKNILFGSRDRVGVKPFYYFKNGNVFAFASEQKALLKLPFVQTGINYKAAADFLAGDIQYIERGQENMFKNIFELMPAENFSIDLRTKAFKKWKYYLLKAREGYVAYNEKNFLQYRDEVEKRLVDSVKLHLRSDVPVGSCLSGGIDSSAIVGIIADLISKGEKVNLGERLNVFTLQFDDKKIDESSWAKYVVDKTNAEWNLVKPTAKDLLKDFLDMNYAQDIPVCSTGTYGQFRLMRRAKEKGIKVILDGQGGDELFGGYMTHSIVFWKEMLRRKKVSTAFFEMSSGGKYFLNAKQLLKDFSKRKFIGFAPLAVQEAFYRNYFIQYDFLNKEIIHQYVTLEMPKTEMEITAAPSLNNALLKDFVNTRLKMYLKYEDRSSMWHSVEARTPFADDHRLVDYVFHIAGSFKIHKDINKYLLREAVRNYLPSQIKERKDKLGFVTPIDKWMNEIKNDCLDFFDSSLNEYMDVKKIKENPEKFFTIRNHAEGVRVFRMVSFAVWKKLFNL